MKKAMFFLFLAVLAFGMTGCMTTEVRNNFADVRNENTKALNEMNKMVEGSESRTAQRLDTVEEKIDQLKEKMIATDCAVEKNASDLIRVEKKFDTAISGLQKKLLQKVGALENGIGTTRLDTGKYTGPKRTWLAVGPFLPGSATAPVASIANDVREVTKTIGKAVIGSATYETVVEEVIGFFDKTPINKTKSTWESNEDLALNRAKEVAKSIGFNELVKISSNSNLFGDKLENNRYVYVLVTTRKVEE